MVNVLLINPPRTCYSGSLDFDIEFPIGLMHVAGIVRDICHVELFDCPSFDVKVKKGSAVTYGASPEQIRSIITEKKPDIVGISVHSTAQYPDGALVATITKEINPKIITVFGGPDPSVRFREILQNSYCDYCVIGDGEETFFEFIKSFLENAPLYKITGLAYKSNNEIHFKPRSFSENLDNLPFPALDMIDVNNYLSHKLLYKYRSTISKKSISLFTSRGCPNRCVFCSVRLHMGQKFRAHSPEYILRLLRFYKEKYGFVNFHFEDDNLICNKARFEEILDLIIRENLQIKWDTPNGVRIDSLDCSLLNKMKRAGCTHLAIAIESGNQRVLNEIINKKLELKKVLEVVDYCKKLKISIHAFYIIGFPGEKISDMNDTIDLAINLYEKFNVWPALFVAAPLYGTDLHDICVRDNLIEREPTSIQISNAIQPSGEPMISTPDFSKLDIKNLAHDFDKRIHRAHKEYLLRHPRELLLEIYRKYLIQPRSS